MTTNEFSGTVHINNGTGLPARLYIDQEMHVETTLLPQPDPNWEHVDSNSHWHAYDNDLDTPTLSTKTEHRVCDGSCGGVCEGEGYTVTRWFCRICGEEVTPGTTEGPHTITVPGLKSWRVEFEHDQWLEQVEVSVRFDAGFSSLFGVAVLTDSTYDTMRDRFAARSTLVGTGPLGRRPATRRSPAQT